MDRHVEITDKLLSTFALHLKGFDEQVQWPAGTNFIMQLNYFD